MTDPSKTIVAIATAIMPSAIGIIRISGTEAFTGASNIFAPFRDKKITPGMMYHGKVEAGEYVDDGMGVYFKSPKSYTGEDCVELYLHGGTALLAGVVGYLIDEVGFTQADGGDFTARAYRAGKLDLTAAEGVADIINATTSSEVRGAYGLLTGKLAERIGRVQSDIVGLRAELEAAIDYPEEDVESVAASVVAEKSKAIVAELDALIAGYREGRISVSGIKVALVGKPNTGKSSLMNALVGFDRAIVTPEAGTTRDALNESFVYGGVRFTLTDTAGVREALSVPEQLGVEKAMAALKEADVVLVVVEAGAFDGDDERLKKAGGSDGREVIVVENKTDIYSPTVSGSARVSALTGAGVDALKERLRAAAGNTSGEGGLLTNMRQYSATVAARKAAARAQAAAESNALPELISADLYEAYDELGKVTGISGDDALAAEIFKRFCVGK